MDTNAVNAVVVGSTLLVLMMLGRFYVQWQRGTLDWTRERGLLIAAPFLVAGLIAIFAGGPSVAVFLLPAVMAGLGLTLRQQTAWATGEPSAQMLRRLGNWTVVVGLLGAVGAVVRLLRF